MNTKSCEMALEVVRQALHDQAPYLAAGALMKAAICWLGAMILARWYLQYKLHLERVGRAALAKGKTPLQVADWERHMYKQDAVALFLSAVMFIVLILGGIRYTIEGVTTWLNPEAAIVEILKDIDCN